MGYVPEMAYIPHTNFEIATSAIYPAWSLLWAVLWIKVARHYGSAAFGTWKANHSGWRVIARDIFDPMMYAFRDFVCRSKFLCRVFELDADKFQGEVIPTSSPGNILRFAILIASFTPISFGLAFAFVPVWRGDPWKLALTLLAMMISILGALGHLFLAHRANRHKWSSVVTYTTLWFLFGPVLVYAIKRVLGHY